MQRTAGNTHRRIATPVKLSGGEARARAGPMKSTIFLSYASSLDETAARIELSLKGEGYAVFRDRTALPPGESFDARIRAAIEESELFVFLISPESVAPGRYTLTELKFAEQKWGHPAGRVLPVLAEPTPIEAMPAFLRAVSILKPRGNLVAEVAAEVARLTAPRWRRMLAPRRLVPAVVALLLVAGGAGLVLPAYLKQRQAEAQAAAQEQAAMERLRSAGLSYWSARAGYENLVKTTLPVLARGTSGAKGERLANLRAHMGWAQYLSGGMAGVHGRDPLEHYRAALEADSANVYAHAMWGFELLRQRRRSPETLAEAKRHFASALESGREREYVRTVQVSALLQTYTNAWIEDVERQKEVLRVVNAMRIADEAKPKGWGPGAFKGKVWPIYYFGFVTGNEQGPLLEALPPAEHLASFRWLFPEDDLPSDRGEQWLWDYIFVRAQVEEYGGDRAGALASYRRLLSESKPGDGRVRRNLERVQAAIRRLGG
jgi:TIR domain